MIVADTDCVWWILPWDTQSQVDQKSTVDIFWGSVQCVTISVRQQRTVFGSKSETWYLLFYSFERNMKRITNVFILTTHIFGALACVPGSFDFFSLHIFFYLSVVYSLMIIKKVLNLVIMAGLCKISPVLLSTEPSYKGLWQTLQALDSLIPTQQTGHNHFITGLTGTQPAASP